MAMRLSDPSFPPLMTIHLKTSPAFSLIEALLSLTILSLMLSTYWGTMFYARESLEQTGNHLRATLLAEQALETVKFMRDQNFGQLKDGTFGIARMGDQFMLDNSPEKIDDFTRVIQIDTTNPEIKKVTAKVSWNRYGRDPGNVTLVTDVTDWTPASPQMN